MAFEELPKPASYLLNIPDPSQGISDAIKTTLLGQQSQREAQSAQDAHAAAQQTLQTNAIAAQQQLAAQQRAQDLRNMWAEESKNPTPQGMTRILTAHPEAAEMVQKAGGVLDEQQVKQLTPIYAPMITGHPDIVKSEIEKAAAAWDDPKNGNPQKAKQLRDLSALYDRDPGGATMNTAAALASSMGPGKFGEAFGKLMGIQTDRDTAAAALEKAQNDAKAGRPAAEGAQAAYDLEQRTKKLAADQAEQTLKTLPEKVQESVGKLTDEAYAHRNLSGRLKMLIAKGESLVNSGKASQGIDIYKDLYGGQDATNNFRNQLEGFLGSSAMGQMASAGGKGGEAIAALAQQGQPGKYDDMKSTVLPYLRRLVDAADKAAPLAEDMARWQTIARGIQKAPRAFTLPSGRKVQPGDFYDSMAKSVFPAIQEAPISATSPAPGSRPFVAGTGWTREQRAARRQQLLAEQAEEDQAAKK